MCITSYDDAMCVGRLPEKRQHDELYNTHRLCMGEDDFYELNDADAYYLKKMMQAIRKDVEDNALYDPGKGDWYDFPKNN